MNISLLTAKQKMHKFFSEFFTPGALFQFIKYIASGLLSAAAEYSLLIILTEYAGLWYLISNSIGYITGFWLSFLLNRFWSFKSRENFLKQLMLYSILFVINFILTNALMYLLTSYFGILYMVSKIFVMGAVVMWNFIIFKKIIYRK